MSDDIYRKLQRHLDRMPVPFPATESGVEIRILKHLFAPEDARVALALSMIPETVGVIHRRLRRTTSRESLADHLARLAERGLITAMPGARGPKYAKAVFAVGFYEAQVNRLTRDFERDVLQYMDEAFGRALHSLRTPQMRTVPVNRVIPLPDRAVGRYDDIAAIVRASKGPFAVMNCICQQGKDLLAEPCRQTSEREHCLTLGSAAEMLVQRADARFVSCEEMLALLERADREGLVLQPQNTGEPLFVCCCCGCCCGVLATAKKLPRPAEFLQSNYFARAEAEKCEACGTCETRCQMDAVALKSDVATVDLERCIGCGLCVSTCPSEAMQLFPKPAQRVPPKDTPGLYMQMFRDRYGTLGLAAAVGRSVLGLKT
jgi:electron transport complex protein RnfB